MKEQYIKACASVNAASHSCDWTIEADQPCSGEDFFVDLPLDHLRLLRTIVYIDS